MDGNDMLFLTRRIGETILIGNDIAVTVVRTGRQVRLRIRAPKHIPVFREELHRRISHALVHPTIADADADVSAT